MTRGEQVIEQLKAPYRAAAQRFALHRLARTSARLLSECQHYALPQAVEAGDAEAVRLVGDVETAVEALAAYVDGKLSEGEGEYGWTK